MDRQDRALLRSAYHDGAIDDHVGFVGDVEDFIDWAFAYHSMQTRYQHFLLNHFAEIDGDTAHADTYYLFVGTDKQPANHMTISGGRYVDAIPGGQLLPDQIPVPHDLICEGTVWSAKATTESTRATKHVERPPFWADSP
jgi:hypothetical protein